MISFSYTNPLWLSLPPSPWGGGLEWEIFSSSPHKGKKEERQRWDRSCGNLDQVPNCGGARHLRVNGRRTSAVRLIREAHLPHGSGIAVVHNIR
jgi:hypothetical protein